MRVLFYPILLLAFVMPIVACSSQKIESRATEKKDPPCEAAALKKKSLDEEVSPCPAPDNSTDEEEDDDESVVPSIDSKPKDILEGVKPLLDEDALKFLTDNCDSCHESKNGSVRSFWSWDKEAMTKEKLAQDSLTPRVFYSLLMRAKNIVGGKPAAMPLKKLTDKKHTELLRMLKWMTIAMPTAVREARVQFGNGSKDDSLGVGVTLDFKCSQPATFREYMRRVTNDAFGREPTQEELALSGKKLDEKATSVDRKAIAKRLFADKKWREEFEATGLRKFAQKIAGAGDIKPLDGVLSQAAANDLKDELYQILKRDYREKAYKDILLGDVTMVTTETASLYGCDAPAGTDKWADCTMKAPRTSYFTTYSYLRSKPSSFLRENNNYGRAAVMHFIVRGDVFKAAFDQDGGKEEIKPLPACLKTKDFRGKDTGTGFAWEGAGAIPLTANLCQSCHIDRQMAAGSILFRPFDPVGHIYGEGHPVDQDPDFANAIKPDMVNRPNLDKTVPDQPVNLAFLESLLVPGADEAACVPGEGDDKEVKLKDVKALAAYLIGDGAVLAGGLARHMPRAFSNLQNTSDEIVVKVNDAFTAGKGKLAPAFEAYFASETYGCKR